MASLTKTIQTELKAISSVAANAQDISSVLDVSSKLDCRIFIDISPQATNTPATELRIEASQKAAGTDTWVPIVWIKTTTDAVAAEVITAGGGAGSSLVTLTGDPIAGSFAADTYGFFRGGAGGINEWGRIVKVDNVASPDTITLQDALTNNQTGATVYSSAQRFSRAVPCQNFTRLRVVCNNNFGGGVGAVEVYWRVAAITTDSIG